MFAFFALTLVSTCLASLIPSEPIQNTVWDARQPQTVSWRSSRQDPPLNLMGKLTISLWTGGLQQQTFLACLTCGRFVNPTRLNTTVQIPADVGPDSDAYFLRIAAPDSLDQDIFTGRFTLTHMTGTFNATVQRQIASISNATLSSSITSLAVSTSSALPLSASSTSASASSLDSSAAISLTSPSVSLFALTILSAISWIYL